MGNQATIQRNISEEVKRVKEATKKKFGNKPADYLVLDQVLLLQPFREHPIDIAHLGTLFVLDSNHDGRITEQEILKFAELFASKKTINHDFQTHLQAFCTLRMWNEVGKEGGIETFVTWFGKLFTENSIEARHFKFADTPEGHRDILFLERETIKTLHRLLNIKLMYGYSYDDFFDLMQRVAEEKGLMSLEETRYDDFVPLPVVQEFGREFISGFARVMTEMGFDCDMRIEIAPEKDSTS